MSRSSEAVESGTMTLAITIDAVDRLSEPAASLADADTWAESVTVLTANPQDALQYTRAYDIPATFFTSRPELGPRGTLELLQAQRDTDRYVLVGASDNDRTLVDPTWEYLTIEHAAEKAGWPLAPESSPNPSLRARLRRVLERLRE